MGDRFRAVAEQAKVPDYFTWHDLRHFYAPALIRNGASVKTVQVRLRAPFSVHGTPPRMKASG
jgi:site-specific recombinase XerD